VIRGAYDSRPGLRNDFHERSIAGRQYSARGCKQPSASGDTIPFTYVLYGHPSVLCENELALSDAPCEMMLGASQPVRLIGRVAGEDGAVGERDTPLGRLVAGEAW
jgi:hypothetical protein